MKELQKVKEALETSQETFKEYTRLHREKGTVSGAFKAARNEDLAHSMKEALWELTAYMEAPKDKDQDRYHYGYRDGLEFGRNEVDRKGDSLSGSEAVYGFAGWITCRDEEVVASSRHDAGVWACLADEFSTANNLAHPQDDFGKRLKHPITVIKGKADAK